MSTTTPTRPPPVLRYKAPGAARLLTASYASFAEIEAGQTISSGTITATRADGESSDLTIGTVTVSGSTIRAMCSGGTEGELYHLLFLATTNAATTPATVLDQLGRLLVASEPAD